MREHHETIHEHEFDTAKHRLHTEEGNKTREGEMPDLGMGMFRETTHQPEKVGSEKHTHHKNIEIKKF
jgi:hypothetical protein